MLKQPFSEGKGLFDGPLIYCFAAFSFLSTVLLLTLSYLLDCFAAYFILLTSEKGFCAKELESRRRQSNAIPRC